jgi:hypothetical protein
MKKFILVFSLLFGSSLLSANSLAVSDQQFLFGKTQNVEAQLISNDEMAQTEGKWIFVANMAAGGIYGGYGYLGYSMTSGNWSTRDFGMAVAVGAASGFRGAAVPLFSVMVNKYAAFGTGALIGGIFY